MPDLDQEDFKNLREVKLFFRTYGGVSFEETESLTSFELSEMKKKLESWKKDEMEAENKRFLELGKIFSHSFNSFAKSFGGK